MRSDNQLVSTIVSCKWLHDNRHLDQLIVLDASVKTDQTTSEAYIPNSRSIDVKGKFSDVNAKFPSAIPSLNQFQNEAQRLGINNNSVIVVYDDKGVYWSPRVWWLFKTFGFKNIAVLDGGLPEWKRLDYETSSSLSKSNWALGNFSATYDSSKMCFFDDVSEQSKDKNTLILDARSAQRFKCLTPEPRKGLRSGTIPNSKNLSFTNVLNGHCLKSEQELKAIFETFTIEEKSLIFSCGSGITACILALAAEISDYKKLTVYDGSWTEYGTLTS
ncbi:sulfurtransferase [Psychroserpens ponticola]|uniref:Sulfurtransferase n=1 Tax=Psychroserpens ponticola TaxID=2932268 RepID=A0ABY7S251_9FLAO|nr:sulfurtransferase [Psychroserpens ponticola]WCO03259.1 sulfurtransferase [Psychroserpens ponticola]